MTKKNKRAGALSAQELQMIERLRQHPELMERFQSILEISANAEGSSKKRGRSGGSFDRGDAPLG